MRFTVAVVILSAVGINAVAGEVAGGADVVRQPHPVAARVAIISEPQALARRRKL